MSTFGFPAPAQTKFWGVNSFFFSDNAHVDCFTFLPKLAAATS